MYKLIILIISIYVIIFERGLEGERETERKKPREKRKQRQRYLSCLNNYF